MSFPDAKIALEKKLLAMSGVIGTFFEGMSKDHFGNTPAVGVPYQKVSFINGNVEDLTMGRKVTKYNKIMQVMLFYPIPTNTGVTLPIAMSEKIEQWFKPCQTLVQSSTKVYIIDSPKTATGFVFDDRWAVPISINFHYYIYG
jgi:hypothetical protein